MKNTPIVKLGACVLFFLLIVISCRNSPDKQVDLQTGTPDGITSEEKTTAKEVEIAGVYTGTDNVGMESTIILQSGGTLIIKASVGDGTPDYGTWTGTADNLSLFHQDELGNDELIGNASVTESGLRIIGGQFYSRQ